jgi:hypothetical protein
MKEVVPRRLIYRPSASWCVGAPPTCYPNDGKTGIGNPGGVCARIPLHQRGFGSPRSSRQGIREMRLLITIQKNPVLPKVVVMPTTRVRAAHQYFTRVSGRPVGQ